MPGKASPELPWPTGRTIYVADAPADPRYIRGEETKERVRSLLVAPVKTTQMNMGTLSVHSSQGGRVHTQRRASVDHPGHAGRPGAVAGAVVRNTQGRLKEINALYGITQGIIEAFDVDTILRRPLRCCRSISIFTTCRYLCTIPDSEALVLRQGTGEAGVKMRSRRVRQPVEKGIVGHVAVSGQAFVTNNVKDVLFYEPNPLLPETNAELVVPLRSGDRRNPGDRILGVLDIHHKAPAGIQRS